MAENENTTPETTGSSRRALLGKAAAAGAVVYAVPMIKSIPAYAAGGIDSVNSESANCCVWFSPAQNSKKGVWHADYTNTVDGIVATASSGVTEPPVMTVEVKTGGTNRGVRFTGSPVNQLGTDGYGKDGSGSYYYGGGGVYIESLDSDCQINIVGVYIDIIKNSTDCNSPYTTYKPASWANGSSETSINTAAVAPAGDVGGGQFQSAYYHSGCQGPNGAKKAPISVKFTVQCK